MRRSRFVVLIAGCALAGVASPIAADNLDVPPPVTWAWSAPTDGAPVHHYEVELAIDEEPFALHSVTYQTRFTLSDVDYMQLYRIRVCAVSAEGRKGPYSEVSEPFIAELPEPPRPPGG